MTLATTRQGGSFNAWSPRLLMERPPEEVEALEKQFVTPCGTVETSQGTKPSYVVDGAGLSAHVEKYTSRIMGRRLRPEEGVEKITSGARDAAMMCRRLVKATGESGGDIIDLYTTARSHVESQGLEPPKPDADRDLMGCVLRMMDTDWWRRQVKIRHLRTKEAGARAAGLVSKHRHVYVSAGGLADYADQQRKNADFISQAVAVCDDTDEEISLEQVVGDDNQKNAELTVRMRGIEQYANRHGYVSCFATITAPPEFHAVESKSGQLLPGKGVSPRQSHRWLMKRWARVRAWAKRHDIVVFGMRVAEPHHDGTAHAHVVLFTEHEQLAELQRAMCRYFIDGDRRKKRKKQACQFVLIDKNRGSATGYVLKYIRKNINGAGLASATTLDDDGKQAEIAIDPNSAATRVRAWASIWGIRQFQFFGCPAVTPWRELRRLREPLTGGAVKTELVRQAADCGDWCEYMQIQGGAQVPPRRQPVAMRRRLENDTNKYGEPLYRPFVVAFGDTLETRPHRWRVERRITTEQPARSGEAASTWSPGFNCTVDLVTTAHRSDGPGRCAPPPPDTPLQDKDNDPIRNRNRTPQAHQAGPTGVPYPSTVVAAS